jgi:hypothetical protein
MEGSLYILLMDLCDASCSSQLPPVQYAHPGHTSIVTAETHTKEQQMLFNIIPYIFTF